MAFSGLLINKLQKNQRSDRNQRRNEHLPDRGESITPVKRSNVKIFPTKRLDATNSPAQIR